MLNKLKSGNIFVELIVGLGITLSAFLPSAVQRVSAHAPNRAAAVSPGLLASYAFSDGAGTTLTDSSGNNHPGTLVNGPTWTAGRYDHALSFDGASNYVTIGDLDVPI